MWFKEIQRALKALFIPDPQTPETMSDQNKANQRVKMGFYRLAQHPFLRNVSIAALGPVVSQTLSVLLSPILTRIYGPEAHGALGVFLSVLSILVPISSLSYTYAIILPRRDVDGLKIWRFVHIFAFIISLLSLLLIGFWQAPLARLLKIEAYGQMLYWLPLTLFFSTAAIANDQWMVRKKQFKAGSLILIAQSLLSNGALISLGLFAPLYASLIGVNILMRGFHALASFFTARRTFPLASDTGEKVDWQSTRQLLRDYRDFPIYRTPQILISTLSYNLPVMLMAIFIGPTAAGLYTLANRVLKLPSIIIAESVGKVFQQRVTEAAQTGRSLQPLILKTTLSLAAVGSIPLGLLIAFGPLLFSFVFGAEWTLAGVFARWMALSVLATFSSVPVVMAIPLLNLQKQYLGFELLSLLLGALSLAGGFMVLQDAVVAVALFSSVSALLMTAWMVFVIVKSKDHNRYHHVEPDRLP